MVITVIDKKNHVNRIYGVKHYCITDKVLRIKTEEGYITANVEDLKQININKENNYGKSNIL